jgi:hypothetical protein
MTDMYDTYEYILYNKELDKWLESKNIGYLKNILYRNGINTLNKLSYLDLTDLERIFPNRKFKTYAFILTQIKRMEEPIQKSLNSRLMNFIDDKASIYSIIYNKYAIDNALTKRYIQYFILLYCIVLFADILTSYVFQQIYSYSFFYTQIDIDICFDTDPKIMDIAIFSRIPKLMLLLSFLSASLLSYFGYNKIGSKCFKGFFVMYLLSFMITNINIMSMCYLYAVDNIEDCHQFCHPWGDSSIPLFEIVTLLNTILFYYYQAIGYRILFIISISKSICGIMINKKHLENETYHINGIKNDMYQLYINILLNILILSTTEFMYIYAHLKAYVTVFEDWKVYRKIYENIIQNEKYQLKKLNDIIKTIKTKPTKQKTDNLDELYDISYILNVKIQKLLYEITRQTCGILVPTTIKNPKRCIEKINRKYNRDTSKICDIIRSSVVFCNNFGCDGTCSTCCQLFRDSEDDSEFMIDIKKNITQCHKFEIQSDHSSLNFDQNNEGTEKNEIVINGIKSPSKKVNFENTKCFTDNSFKNHICNINTSIHNVNCNHDTSDSGFLCENFLLFLNQLKENEYIEIVKIKNKYEDKNGFVFFGGYRDILINIKVHYVVFGDNLVQLLEKSESKKHTNYIICEVQLHSIEMYQYKCTLGHANYKKYRNWLCL